MLHSGDPSGLASISTATPTTIPALRAIGALASPHDILRVLAPDKAAVVASTLRQISALSDYVQSLSGASGIGYNQDKEILENIPRRENTKDDLGGSTARDQNK